MGRQSRIVEAGSHVLVTNRGTAQTVLFRTNSDRRAFLALLSELDQTFGVCVIAYVLMGNHYHLVVRLESARLGDAMQFLDGRYARRFNAVHDRSGALFQGRYDARILDSEVGLQGAGYYVHLIPLRAGLTINPVAYPWSSLPAYVRGRSTLGWLGLDLLRGRSGDEYRRAVDAACADEPVMTRSGADDHALFTDWADERGADRAFTALDQRVAAQLGVSIDELYIVRAGKPNLPRTVAIALALQRSGQTAAVVASRYGLRSRGAVYLAARRSSELAADEPRIAALLAPTAEHIVSGAAC